MESSDDDDIVSVSSTEEMVETENNSSLESRLNETEKQILSVQEKIDILHMKLESLNEQKQELKTQLDSEKSKELLKIDWKRTDHSWSNRLQSVLKDVFKIESLRSSQLPAINAVLSGQDVILIMPTGGGKSLCFQLASLIFKGFTLVVSPLVSLMEDQMMALKRLNVNARMLSASLSRSEVTTILTAMTDKNSKLKLLYVTPEKLAKSKRFMSKLQKAHAMGLFSLLAIDEVHCCSHWGHDFRPDYKFLGIMKRQYPNVPIMGLTATSTSQVTQDVQNILNIQGCLVLKSSFNRPNLKYKVLPKNASTEVSVDELAFLIKGTFKGQSGIVYCFSIKESEDLCRELQNRGILCGVYHAQLEAKYRSEVHTKWSTNEIQVVVATVAFGMGIDKSDVRFVIHHSLSKSMENYYQESGRAGRDGQPADCIVFFRLADVFRQSGMVFTEKTGLTNLYAMLSYCVDNYRCRRQIIAQHFGEVWKAGPCNKMCDHCANSLNVEAEMELTDVTKSFLALASILEHAQDMKERLTMQKLLDAWQGKGPSKLRVAKAITSSSREMCETLLAFLLIEGFLKEDFHFTPYSTISYICLGAKARLAKEGKLPVKFMLPRQKRKASQDESNAKRIALSEDKG